MNDVKTNDRWKVSPDEFRGYMRAKLENIEFVGTEQRKDMTAVKKDIVRIKLYIAGAKAVQKFRSSLWGSIGGVIAVVVGFCLYKLFGK